MLPCRSSCTTRIRVRDPLPFDDTSPGAHARLRASMSIESACCLIGACLAEPSPTGPPVYPHSIGSVYFRLSVCIQRMPAGHPNNNVLGCCPTWRYRNGYGATPLSSCSSQAPSRCASHAACWHDLLMASEADGTAGCTAVHAPGGFASDYVPLWAGVAAAGSAQARSVVSSLQRSGTAACHVSMLACRFGFGFRCCRWLGHLIHPRSAWFVLATLPLPFCFKGLLSYYVLEHASERAVSLRTRRLTGSV